MAMQANLFGMAITKHMKDKACEEGRPISATFELTPRCGLNCRMCYVHLPSYRIPEVGRGRELTAEEWLGLGQQAFEMGVLSLCVTGGDPLCHPEFKKIWAGLAMMGFRIILQTNAFSITEDMLEFLENYPPDMIKITLYGASDKAYQEVCRVEHGFTAVAQGIQKLQDRGFRIQLVTTVIKQNRAGIDRIAAYARSKNLPWYYSASCYPSLRGADSEAKECALDVWELECAEETARLWKELPVMKEEKVPGAMCSGYRTEFNVSWDGYMRFCLFLNEPNISVTDMTLEQCWEQLLRFWGSVKWPQPCYSCEDRKECTRCLAHLACLNGGLGKVSEDYCRNVRKMLASIAEEDKE